MITESGGRHFDSAIHEAPGPRLDYAERMQEDADTPLDWLVDGLKSLVKVGALIMGSLIVGGVVGFLSVRWPL